MGVRKLGPHFMSTKQTKFKVGDRVFYKYNGSEHTYGTIKTIDEKHKSFRSFGKTRYFPYNVLFDNGNCYWYSASELQLLPKKKTVKRKTVKAWAVMLGRGQISIVCVRDLDARAEGIFTLKVHANRFSKLLNKDKRARLNTKVVPCTITY